MSRQNIFLKIRSFLEWRFSQLCSTCDVDRKNAPLPYESQWFFCIFDFRLGSCDLHTFLRGAGPGDFSIFGARLRKKRHRKSATQIYEKQAVLKKYIKTHILKNRNCCNTKNKKCRFPKKHKSKNNALFVGDAIADFHVFCDAVQGADVSGEVLRIDIKS